MIMAVRCAVESLKVCAQSTNETVKTMIRCYLRGNHEKSSDNLAALGCAIRTAKSEVIGYSPFFVNFGHEFRLHGDEYCHPVSSDEPHKC